MSHFFLGCLLGSSFSQDIYFSNPYMYLCFHNLSFDLRFFLFEVPRLFSLIDYSDLKNVSHTTGCQETGFMANMGFSLAFVRCIHHK